MTQTALAENTAIQPPKNKINGQAKPSRAISDPKEVTQLVMMRIDHVNSKKDELTITVKALADNAKQLVSVYANRTTGDGAQLILCKEWSSVPVQLSPCS